MNTEILPISTRFSSQLKQQLEKIQRSQVVDSKAIEKSISKKIDRLKELEVSKLLSKEEHIELMSICFELGEISGKLRVSYFASQAVCIELFMPTE